MLNGNLTYWVLQTVAMLLTALVLPGLRITSIFGAIIIVVLLGYVNASIWDAALFYQVPNTLSMHTVLLLISNAVVFWLLVKIVPGIEMKGIVIALVAPVVFTLFSLLIDSNFKGMQWGLFFSEAFRTFESFRDRLLQG